MTPSDDRLDLLGVEDLLEIAAGVLPETVVRDPGLLSSAAARPQTAVFGEEAYPGFAGKAASLMHSLARNDPLLDGNKRLAWAATRVFCLLNGRDVAYGVDDADALLQAIARGALDVPQLAQSIGKHLRTP